MPNYMDEHFNIQQKTPKLASFHSMLVHCGTSEPPFINHDCFYNKISFKSPSNAVIERTENTFMEFGSFNKSHV